MAHLHNDEQSNVYYIPSNIFDGFTFFKIPLRNWIEAAITAVLPGILLWNFLPITMMLIRLIVVLLICIPIGVFALIGFHGESMSQFIKSFLSFRKNRRVLHFEIGEADSMENPFIEDELRLDELRTLIRDTKDKEIIRKLHTEAKELERSILKRKNELRKQQAEDDKEIQAERQRRHKEQEEVADALAMKEIQRRKEAGEKRVNKKKVIQEYREKMVPAMPLPPKKEKRISENLSTQDFIPIDRIEKRTIITKAGRCIRVIGVVPLNYPMMPVTEQNYLLSSFGYLLKAAPVNIQAKAISKSADVGAFLQAVEERIGKESGESTKRMMRDYQQLLRDYSSSSSAVTRLFILVVEYDESNATKNTTDEERRHALDRAVSRVKTHFKRCGNTVFDFPDMEEETDFLYRLFFDITDRFNALGMNYTQRILHTYEQFSENEHKELSAADFIAPLTIDFTHSRYVVVDGTYYSYLYIPSNSFAPHVMGAWLSPIINLGGGFDVDIFYERGDRDTVRGATRRQMNLSSAQLSGNTNTNTDSYDALSNKSESARFIKEGLSRGEDFYDISVMITVIAGNEEALFARIRAVQDLMEDMDMSAVLCNYHHEEAFLGSLPLCHCPDIIRQLGHHNMLTGAASATYPFSSYELTDEDGILLGVNASNGSLVIPNIFDTKRYKNANSYIIGASGSGKTYNLLSQSLRSRELGEKVYIIAPLKGHEFKRASESVDGQYIRLMPGSVDCINIMEIRPVDAEAARINKALDGLEEESLLGKKISSIEVLFEIMMPDIQIEEAQLLNTEITALYKNFGITQENTSLYQNNRPSKFKTMPTLKDLYDAIQERPELRRVYNVMSKFVVGSASNFSGATNVNLENMYTVIDVSGLDKKMMPIAMYIALDYMWDSIKTDRTSRKRIYIDEIWHLIGSAAPITCAEFVQEIFKTIRGYGGGAVAATQEIIDFFSLADGAYGKAVLNACSMGTILRTEANERKTLEKILELTPRDVEMVRDLEFGTGLVRGAGSNLVVRIVASPLENDLITTDRKQLIQIADGLERVRTQASELGFVLPKEQGQLLTLVFSTPELMTIYQQ